jgi:hypothetical protein
LRIDQPLGANQLVACPHCKLKFVPPAASGTDSSRGSFLPWVLLAVVVGLGVGGVAWNNFARNTDEKPADPKPPAIAQNSQNGAQQPGETQPPPKKIAETPETPKPSPANGEQSPDDPKPMPKKTPPKTYAETKQGLNDVPPPPVVEKKAPPVVEKKAPPPVVETKPPPPVEVKAPPLENKKPPSVAVNPPPKFDHPKQRQIDDAIEKGVAFLKREQLVSGSWPIQPGGNNAEFVYDVGYAALGGLTLLECKVPANDPAVKKAVAYVRGTPVRDRKHRNYQISCVILFLDRLGDPRDRGLIQAYALELVAGQNARGAWTYESPTLSGPEMQQLLSFLEATRLPGLEAHPAVLDPLSGKAATGDEGAPVEKKAAQPVPKKATGKPPAFGTLSRAVQSIPVVQHWYFPDKAKAQAAPGALATVPGGQLIPPAPPQPLVPMQPNAVPGQPLIGQPNPTPGAPNLIMGNTEDNSNTQFAMLALWAARRHGVPTERCFIAAGQRFVNTQMQDGGWTYMSSGFSTPAMTCVGLLGVAMAQGVTPAKNGADEKLAEVPAVAKGLFKLGDYIDEKSMRDLYYLWSLERVGMLYHLRTIGHKDWYDVASEMLLQRQLEDGRWAMHSYVGSCASLDTMLALLVLKRSNLVQDLTERLPLLMSIPDRTPTKP